LVRSPGFPAEWDHASLRHADVTVSFKRDGLRETFIVEPRFAKPMTLRLRAAALRDRVESVQIDGAAAEWRAVADRVGTPAIEIVAPPRDRHEVSISRRSGRRC
jgi:hypothetical protein